MTTRPRTAVSIIVPVYGDGAALEELVRRVAAILEPEYAERWEIILVNDGSPVGCWALIESLTRRYPVARGINFQRNFGQHNALLAGIELSRGDVIVTLDDDLQHPPEEIPKLLRRFSDDVDLIYGTPVDRPHGAWRNATSVLAKVALASVLGASTAREISAFRAFRGSLRKIFSGYRSPYVNIDVLLSWGTTRITSVPVSHEPRRFGPSQYNLWRLLRHLLNMITGFSVWPLRLASVVGFLFMCFAVLVLIYVVGRFIWTGRSVPGFPFLASIITLLSGAQLFALGIMGEYLARLYFRAVDRPPYIIEATANTPGG